MPTPRGRLADLGWFMKSLKEPLARLAILRLVDASSRMIRAGKASLEADMAPIFQRMGLDHSALDTQPATNDERTSSD